MTNSKRNKLLDLRYSEHDPLRTDENRCTGQSTAQALHLIAWCIENPGLPKTIVDHYGTRATNANLACIADNIIDKLDLKFFELKQKATGQMTLQCNIWRDATDENRS